MKKILTFMTLLMVTAIAVIAQPQVTRDTIPTNLILGGDSILEILKNTWPIFAMVLYSILEFYLGQTGKVKAGSFLALVLNILGKMIRKRLPTPKARFMSDEQIKAVRGLKTLALLVLFSLFAGSGTAMAQGPLDGFFKLSKQNPSVIHMIEHNKDMKASLAMGQIKADDVTFIDHEWILRPAMGVKGFEIQFDPQTWEPTKRAFDEVALGLGYQKYKDVDGKPVNTIGVNLLFFFRDADITQLQLKNAVTFHFWQLIDVGIGRDWASKYWFLLTGLSYSF